MRFCDNSELAQNGIEGAPKSCTRPKGDNRVWGNSLLPKRLSHQSLVRRHYSAGAMPGKFSTTHGEAVGITDLTLGFVWIFPCSSGRSSFRPTREKIHHTLEDR